MAHTWLPGRNRGYLESKEGEASHLWPLNLTNLACEDISRKYTVTSCNPFVVFGGEIRISCHSETLRLVSTQKFVWSWTTEIKATWQVCIKQATDWILFKGSSNLPMRVLLHSLQTITETYSIFIFLKTCLDLQLKLGWQCEVCCASNYLHLLFCT